MDKKKLKKAYHDMIDELETEHDIDAVIEKLQKLNETLERFDSALRNFFDDVKLTFTLTNRGKMKDYVSDILDHYDDYTAMDKKHINDTLEAIKTRVYNNKQKR